MSRLNRNNIDRKTNKPNPKKTEGYQDDRRLNRENIIRRDDDVIRTPKRTLYDIDYALKWYVENKIRPQVISNKNPIPVPVIFSNGEKWDNVQRLGYIRDEKGMLQSPLIMLKRNSATERDNLRGLDVNNQPNSNRIIHRMKYNKRNRYEDTFFPLPVNKPKNSQQYFVVDIPKYVDVEYDLMLWCDFTTQLNELVDQIFPHNRYSWGDGHVQFEAMIGNVNFETVNTIGEDRLVRATMPLTVKGTVLPQQETNVESIKKLYSPKQIQWNSSFSGDPINTSPSGSVTNQNILE